MADDAPDLTPDDTEDDGSFFVEAAELYNEQTERLKVYASLLRATVPRIGSATRLDGGQECDLDPDVESYRNLAVVAIFADIRRIAGDGIKVNGEDSR